MKTLLGLMFAMVVGVSAYAQSTATINGRVTDSAKGVVAGAAVTATNEATGVARNTLTNSEGLYTIPALEPGIYDVSVNMTGFAPSIKKGATLVTDTTLTFDFTLGVAGTAQQIEVLGETQMIETTQSEVSGSLQTSEVQNLPIINRSFTGLITLIPGARPGVIYNPTKVSMGIGMSVSGGNGRNINVEVDGADNRDDIIGGPVQNYTLEGIQEFNLHTHDFSSQYGRASGAVLQIATKSGTNQLHGSAFAFGRSDAFTAIDYFSKQQGLSKSAYDREQFGGSLGGRIIKDKWFFFGAVERIQQNFDLTVPGSLYNQALLLVGIDPVIKPTSRIPEPYRDTLYTLKTDYQINNHHSLSLRWAQQVNSLANDQYGFGTNDPDQSAPNEDLNQIWSIVGSDTWIISNNSVNKLGFQYSYYRDNLDITVPNPGLNGNLTFPSIAVGRPGGTDQNFYQQKWDFSDDFYHQIGKHSLKIGGDFAFYPYIAIISRIGDCGRTSFFDDPSTILTNTTKYPQGFRTPGAVSSVSIGTCDAGGPMHQSISPGQKLLGAYVQDDWKIKPRVTLNLGVRYDLSVNFFGQRLEPNNRVYQVLKALNSPYAILPKNPNHDFAPRVGFAWDMTGNGKNVLRASYGIFFAMNQLGNNSGNYSISQPNISLSSSYVNSGVGVGQLSTYVFGVSPPPLGPPAITTQLPAGANTSGSFTDGRLHDPYTGQANVGYTRQLTSNMIASVEYTHIEGIHEYRLIQINPLENAWDPTDADQHIPFGTRRLEPAMAASVYGPNILGSISVEENINQSTYQELLFHLERRAGLATFQATYTLASAYGWGGGVEGNGGGGATPMPSFNQDNIYGPGEWGPALQDERHRVVLSGVFNLPWGVQPSPIFQYSSARPYNLTAGSDCNKDGVNNDYAFMNPSTGAFAKGCTTAAGFVQVPINYKRGSPIYTLDLRVTKFFNFGEVRKLGVFAEFYNLTNRANFANQYNGNSLSATFLQPTGLAAGIPNSRQMQLGARFIF